MRDTSFAKWRVVTVIILIAFLAASVSAVPPSPDAIKMWKSLGVYDQKITQWHAAEGEYGSEPSPNPPYDRDKLRASIAAGDQEVDTIRVMVVLVDFPDNQHTIPAQAFDSLLFSQHSDPVHNPTGSMTDYYAENSYGKVFIEGHVFGWYRMPHSYASYVPIPSELANEAVAMVDPDVDFKDYAEPGSATFNGFILIHAGPGQEGDTCSICIWSHKGSCSAEADSIYVNEYTVNPEVTWGNTISQIGVFCHEYGHILGLRDYYDTQYHQGSSGLGDWSIMAAGSWNGTGGNSPAHFDAYNKVQLGFVNPIILNGDGVPQVIERAEIPQVESEPVVYWLRNWSADWWQQSWYVENRQRVGFDRALPGSGLLIYHVDVSQPTNDDPSHYRVAVEQADGLNELAFGGFGGQGDSGDPWPGSTNNRSFHDMSVPNSRTYPTSMVSSIDSVATQIGVWNVSDSDSLMYADLETKFTHPWALLAEGDSLRFFDGDPPGEGEGNGDRHIDPGERINFYCTVRNAMGMSYYPIAILSADNAYLQFVSSSAPIGTGIAFNPALESGQATREPIVFDVAPTATYSILHFTLTVSSYLSFSDTASQVRTTMDIPFDVPLGNPTAVGDDNDGSLPEHFELSQNYPNPFNPTTHILYSVAATPGQGPVHTNLTVFNVLGQKVRTLVDKVQSAGTYTIDWDGTSDNGVKVSSGIYFYRITSGDFVETRKMALLK